jgi:putative membrane protein
MKKAVTCAVGVFAVALMASGAAIAQSPTSPAGAAKSGADSTFVKEAAMGGLAEVELGRLATQKASSTDVKQFGQRMVDDHSKANDQLKPIAQQKNIPVPTQLTGKEKSAYDRLSKLSGEQFDRAYVQMMLEDHRKDVAEFKKESTSGKDSEVKSFAAQALPTLEEHLKMVQSIAATPRATSGKSEPGVKGTTGTTGDHGVHGTPPPPTGVAPEPGVPPPTSQPRPGDPNRR